MTNIKESKKKAPKGQPKQQEQPQPQQREERAKKAVRAVNNNGAVATQAETTTRVEEPHPFLGREVRVVLSDHRVVVGTLIAYMGMGDLLLQSAVEQRRYADGEESCRPLALIAVPLRHVTAMHRRQPNCEPITLADGRQ